MHLRDSCGCVPTVVSNNQTQLKQVLKSLNLWLQLSVNRLTSDQIHNSPWAMAQPTQYKCRFKVSVPRAAALLLTLDCKEKWITQSVNESLWPCEIAQQESLHHRDLKMYFVMQALALFYFKQQCKNNTRKQNRKKNFLFIHFSAAF